MEHDSTQNAEPFSFPLNRSETLKFGGIYFILSLINLRIKLLLTPAWRSGILDNNHQALLDFAHTNNEQSRLLQFYLPEALRIITGVSIPEAYIIQRWLFVALAFLVFHAYLRRWFDNGTSFGGVAFLAAIMPLTYFDHLQESAPLLLLLFVAILWTIRDKRIAEYVVLLTVGALTNETVLFLPAVFFFYHFEDFDPGRLLRLVGRTILYALPAITITGVIRYITRDSPHLSGVLHLQDNFEGIINSLAISPLDYWRAAYLYIFFVFGLFWIFAYLRFSQKPLFLRRSLLTVPFFVLPHMIAGIVLEVRLMLPLAFILIPATFFYLFVPPSHSGENRAEQRRKKRQRNRGR